MATRAVGTRGYFSLLRWRRDVARDEARNVAVILVDAEGPTGLVRHAPLSNISQQLQEQGLLDALLVGLQKQLSRQEKPAMETLKQLRASLQHSLYLTEPQPAAITDSMERVLGALYKAYVSPRGSARQKMSKGQVLDRVVERLRGSGLEVERGQYVGEFLFDVVIHDAERPRVMEVLSFGTTARNWAPVEYDAGHFLYALHHVDQSGLAVLQPPTESSTDAAWESYERVRGWFNRDKINMVRPDELVDQQLALPV